jgi:hypothetical protein
MSDQTNVGFAVSADDDRRYEEFVKAAEASFMKPAGSLRPSLAELRALGWLPQRKSLALKVVKSPIKPKKFDLVRSIAKARIDVMFGHDVRS